MCFLQQSLHYSFKGYTTVFYCFKLLKSGLKHVAKLLLISKLFEFTFCSSQVRMLPSISTNITQEIKGSVLYAMHVKVSVGHYVAQWLLKSQYTWEMRRF